MHPGLASLGGGAQRVVRLARPHPRRAGAFALMAKAQRDALRYARERSAYFPVLKHRNRASASPRRAARKGWLLWRGRTRAALGPLRLLHDGCPTLALQKDDRNHSPVLARFAIRHGLG